MGTTAIYGRISLDRNGDAAGVDRQIADAEALAEARGLELADRFIDNDRSAYSGRARPEWERLLKELGAGAVTNVIAWANDRLYRRARDQLELMEAVRAAGGVIVTVKDGDVDPSSAEGRMRMGILANVAEFESARKAERVARASEQRAATGRPHGRPPFGWQLDSAGEWALELDQAGLVRDAAARVLHGESVGSVVADWNEQQLATPAGAPRWTPQTLRKILRRPTNAALRVHRGEIAGPATWPPILDVDTYEAVVARLSGRGQQRPRRYLLTTIVACSDDGERMVGHKAKSRGYECIRCGRRIDADRLDDHVVEAVLRQLATPRLAERLARARADTTEADALQELQVADARLAELAAMFGAGELELDEYRSAQRTAKQRRAEAERRLASRRSSFVLAEAAAASVDGLQRVWDEQGLGWRRELVRAVVEAIEVGPSTRPAWAPERVAIKWRTAG